MIRHRLTAVDAEARSAVCSVCGPVRVRANGPSWTCATVAAQRNARWRERHPENVRLSRAHVSSHKLVTKDPAAGTGECPLCGLTAIVPYGRGYTCVNSPGAARRTAHQDAPLAGCRDCRSYYQVVDGLCLSCREMNKPGNTWNRIDQAFRRVSVSDFVYSMTEQSPVQHGNTLFVDDRKDRTNPRMKTIGSSDEVSPEWAWALNPNADWSAFDAEANA